MHDHQAKTSIRSVKNYFIASLVLMGCLLYGYKTASALEISISGGRVQAEQKTDMLTSANPRSPGLPLNCEKPFTLQLGGGLQVDYHYYEESSRTDNRFDIRKARLLFSGYFDHCLYYRLESELQGNYLVDAYAEASTHGLPFLRIGQFQEPFSLEEQTKDTAFFFGERSIGNHFSPGHDRGLMIYGSLFLNSINYAAGLFNGYGTDGSSGGQNDDTELAARLLFTPFVNSPWPLLQSIQFGGSVTKAKIDLANVNIEVKSAGMIGTKRNLYVLNQNTKFGLIQDVDQRHRQAIEAACAWGPLAIQGEYICLTYTDLEPAGGSIKDADFSSWYASALFFFTGESTVFKGGIGGIPQPVKPKRDLNVSAGAWGGFALALRKEHFSGDKKWITKDTFVSVREAEAFSVALNWLMNPAIRLILDYTHTDFSDPIKVRVNPDGGIDYIQDEQAVTVRFFLTF